MMLEMYGESKWTSAEIHNLNVIIDMHAISNQLYYTQDSLFASTSTSTDNANYSSIICDITRCPNFYDVGGIFQTGDFLSSYVFTLFLECLQISSLLCFWSDCDRFPLFLFCFEFCERFSR